MADTGKSSSSIELLASGDFLLYLQKQGLNLCKLYNTNAKDAKGKDLQITDEKLYLEELGNSVNKYLDSLKIGSNTESIMMQIQKGFNRAKIWFLFIFITYILAVITHIIFTFALIRDIDGNEGETKQISKNTVIAYLTIGLSIIWVSIIFFILIWWLVRSRICGFSKTAIYVMYGLMIFVILYAFFSLVSLVSPIANGEKIDESNLFFSLTNIFTWILFGLLILAIVVIASLLIYNQIKKNKEKPEEKTQ